jgi:uncharacterized Rmd1/YagE family protein
MHLKACVVADEIDLNELAIKYGIPKKYTWEEPLVLNERQLGSEKKVFVFAFGSVVFFNFERPEIVKFMGSLKDVTSGDISDNFDRISDEYEIRLWDGEDFHIADEYASVPSRDDFYDELAATVIAKSAALEKIELMLGQTEDKVEAMIDQLEEGKANLSNAEVAKTTSDILRIQYITISYIMILDKPDVTWGSSQANLFYDKMAEFFELSDRYEVTKKKLDILNNIKEGFTNISFTNRGLRMEWAIVILIVVEVIIMLIELFR